MLASSSKQAVRLAPALRAFSVATSPGGSVNLDAGSDALWLPFSNNRAFMKTKPRVVSAGSGMDPG
jgi:hypothetical protein